LKKKKCALRDKDGITISLIESAIQEIKDNKSKKVNVIWLETSGCAGEIISFLNARDPDVMYFLKEMVNLKYSNSLMAAEGGRAYEQFLETLKSEFILLVDGAIPIKDNGLFNVIAKYKGKTITAMEAVSTAARYAKYIISVGTCASYGGPTAANPNVSLGISVSDFLDSLNKKIIKIPGCPAIPSTVTATIAHLIYFEEPELDEDGRPIVFYGHTIHDNCPRRSYFDNKQFADKFGQPECMFKLGCRGPITKTYCPISRWNNTDNWPIGNNTTCIGCAAKGFPDTMQPTVRY
jgi:hydrogenase small subunit